MTTQTLDRGACLSGAGLADRRRADVAGGPRRPVCASSERPFDDIPRADWDGLAARNPWATPFSAWAFHRAWWDAYGANAHEQTLVVVRADAPADGRATPIAIVPLMHRHEVEPTDAADPHDDAPRRRRRPDAGRARRDGRLLRGLATTPTTRRSSRRPPTCRRSRAALAAYLAEPASREPGTSSTCAACAAATRPRRRWRRPSARARSPKAGRSTSSARTSARS